MIAESSYSGAYLSKENRNIYGALMSQFDNDTFEVDSYFDDGYEYGGYNHFELRNYERGYDLKRNDGLVIQKGERAPQFYDSLPAI